MGLAEDIKEYLPFFRGEAESMMTETITAGQYKEGPDASLHTVRTLESTSYEGIARVKYPSLVASDRNPVGQQVVSTDVMVGVPLSSPHIPAGSIIHVVSSTSDGELVGREYQVKGPAQSGQVTSHRYPVEELT